MANLALRRRANLRQQVELKGSDVVCMYTDLTREQLYHFIGCFHDRDIDTPTARLLEFRLSLPDGSLDAKPADGGCDLHRLLEMGAKLDDEWRDRFIEELTGRIGELDKAIEEEQRRRPKH